MTRYGDDVLHLQIGRAPQFRSKLPIASKIQGTETPHIIEVQNGPHPR